MTCPVCGSEIQAQEDELTFADELVADELNSADWHFDFTPEFEDE